MTSTAQPDFDDLFDLVSRLSMFPRRWGGLLTEITMALPAAISLVNDT